MNQRLYDLRSLLVAAGLTSGDIPTALGIGGPEYRKYRDHGMSREVAERKAMKVGLHPFTVWPELVEDDLASRVRLCPARGCSESFVLAYRGGANRRYCSKRCKAREAKRRAYTKPERAEKLKARVRAYHAETREYQARQRRLRYQANAEAERAARRERYRQSKAA